jgi:site-specific DNA-adenine methylase
MKSRSRTKIKSSRKSKLKKPVKISRKKISKNLSRQHVDNSINRSKCRGKREGNAFRYMGGKAAIASDIHDVIVEYEQKLIGKHQPYLEPFAGAMSVALKFALDAEDGDEKRSISVCDYNPDMTRLWAALKAGKKPPKYVTEQEYNRYKRGKSPMKGYVGSVFAFGGGMFGYYRGRCQSKQKTQQEGLGSYNKLMKVIPLLKYISVKRSQSYDKFNVTGYTIYCDPPYEETVSENSNPNKFLRGFDHEKFWEVMRSWSKKNLVFISEVKENIPSDFTIVWKKTIKRSYNIKSIDKIKTEVLCIHKSWIK